MIGILTSPLFYLFLTVGIYFAFALLQKRFKTPLFNPLLWTVVLLIGYIVAIVAIDKGNLTPAELSARSKEYRSSVSILDILLGPVTVALALPLYANRHVLKENWLAIIVATIVGTGTSIASVFLLGWALGISQDLTIALIPRGVTTAIAKEVTLMFGLSDYAAITVTVVVITGVVGAILGPLLIKLFRGGQDETSIGLSLGSASHAIGTSKAFDYSAKAGAIASVSIVTNGLLTVLVSLVLMFTLGRA